MANQAPTLEDRLLHVVGMQETTVDDLVSLLRKEATTVRAVDVKIAAMNLVNEGRVVLTDSWAIVRPAR
jgi:hypothetical protein